MATAWDNLGPLEQGALSGYPHIVRTLQDINQPSAVNTAQTAALKDIQGNLSGFLTTDWGFLDEQNAARLNTALGQTDIRQNLTAIANSNPAALQGHMTELLASVDNPQAVNTILAGIQPAQAAAAASPISAPSGVVSTNPLQAAIDKAKAEAATTAAPAASVEPAAPAPSNPAPAAVSENPTAPRDLMSGLGALVGAAASGVELTKTPGFFEFTRNVGGNESLRTSLGQIMGGEGGSALSAETLGRLEAMAEQDPQVFNKLNTLVKAEGAEGFLKTVAGNPEMQAMFSADGGADSTLSTVKTIDALHQAVERRPDFFKTSNEMMNKYPQMFASMAGAAGDTGFGDASMGIQALEWGVWGHEMQNNLLGMISSFLGPEMAEWLGGLFDKLIETQGPALIGNVSSTFSAFTGTAAAAPEEIAASADIGEAHSIGNDGGTMARQLTEALRPGMTLTVTEENGVATYQVADAGTVTPAAAQQPGYDPKRDQTFTPIGPAA